MEKLLAACSQLPTDLKYIRNLLESENYSPEVLSAVMLRHAETNCWYEVGDFLDANGRYPEKHEVHSAYLYELTELMLEFGFDPNLILEHDGFVCLLDLVDYGYIAADTMRLLLEHGADPNLRFESDTLFESLDANIVIDVSYGFVGEVKEDNNYLYPWRIYDIKFHMWLVLMGYGAKLNTGKPPVTMTNDQPLTIFRQHERFDFRIEYTKEARDGWIMHIFDRNTCEEVATL